MKIVPDYALKIMPPENPIQNPNDLQFNSTELLQFYFTQNYDLLSEKLIKIIEHFEQVTYVSLTAESRYFINAFVKNFLYI
jgi:hypothetical protein